MGWQFAVLAGAAVLLLALRRGVVLTLLTAAGVGLIVAFAGGPCLGRPLARAGRGAELRLARWISRALLQAVSMPSERRRAEFCSSRAV